MEGMRRTGLIQPGSLFESKYRIRLPSGADPRALRKKLEQRFASAGWEFKDRARAAPGANRFFERMGQFLSLIGRSEEHTSELQSLMRISYAVFCLTKKNTHTYTRHT